MVLAAPIIRLMRAVIKQRFFEELLMIVVILPFLLLMALPIAAAAYDGRYQVLRRDSNEKSAPLRGRHIAAFLSCTSLSGVTMVAVPCQWMLVASVLAVSPCGACLSAQKGSSIWHAATLCVSGGLAGYVALVVYDSALGGP
jgi:hypothetical protein